MKKLFVSFLEASQWFVFSFLFLFFAIFLQVIVSGNSLLFTFLDLFLYVVFSFIFVPLLNKTDARTNKIKGGYVSVKINDWRIIVVLIVHLFYFTLFFISPLIGFWLIMPWPFIASFYRMYVKKTKTFPAF